MSNVDISIHAPRTGSDLIARVVARELLISIHAPRTGSDFQRALNRVKTCLFQSTLPARGATSFAFNYMILVNISIHAPRTGSDHGGCCTMLLPPISIHAPRTGSDGIFCNLEIAVSKSISIHAPRTGSDGEGVYLISAYERFQSTLPARGATEITEVLFCFTSISIHAPRTGSDILHLLLVYPN